MQEFDPEFVEGDHQPESEPVFATGALHETASRRARFLAVLEGKMSAADFAQELIDRVDREMSPAFQQ